MSSPITSVPDPSETTSSPLASIITQVQPGQTPAARTSVPRAPAKKKKKKKSSPTSPTTTCSPTNAASAEDAAKNQEQAVAEAARLGSQAAQSQARAQSSTGGAVPAIATASVAAPVGGEERGEARGEEGQHSHQASSTLVGNSSAGNTLTPTTTAAAVAAEQGGGSVDGKIAATESSEGTVEKDGLIHVPPRKHDSVTTAPATTATAVGATKQASTTNTPATASSTPAKTTPASTNNNATTKPNAGAGAKGKAKKPSFGAKLIAFLTCSSATSVAVQQEMSEKKRTTTTTPVARNAATAPTTTSNAGDAGMAGVVVPPRTSNSKSGSAPNPDYPTTPGGGTQLPKAETGDVMSGAVVPPGSSFVTPLPPTTVDPTSAPTPTAPATTSSVASSIASDETSDEEIDLESDYDDITEEQRLIASGGIGIPLDEFGNPSPLLPPLSVPDLGRKCLVLDLDETLVHSSFKMIQNADFIVPVEIDGTVHNVYVIKRPGVDEFMRQMGKFYEVVVFTASLSKYADPVLDMLDIHQSVRHRLFRESCYNHKGNYVKDLSQLGREIGQSIIIDNSPASYIFHPNNAVPVSSWFNDPHDTELTDLVPFLVDLSEVDDVRAVLDGAL